MADRDEAGRSSCDVNPEVKGFLLGEEEEIDLDVHGRQDRWAACCASRWATRPGKRYPLIVAIHGGPAGADLLRFNGGYGTQPYAGDGYAVLMPNYRGSTNYGNAFQTAIVGQLLHAGLRRHHDRRGPPHRRGDRRIRTAWACSAGAPADTGRTGSSTHTDRFKAISSGAGT